jgi:hypothetical protein
VSAFSTLSSDLQSGNLSAAQNDYTAIQNDLESAAAQGPPQGPPPAPPSGNAAGDSSSSVGNDFTSTIFALLSSYTASSGSNTSGTTSVVA